MDDGLEGFALRLAEITEPDADGSRRLPPERELCERLDLSRGALRDRLSRLESIGILSRRQGSGTTLRAPDGDFIRTSFTMMSSLGFLTDDDVAEAREMLETVVAVRAAERADAADVERLRSLVDDMVARTAEGDADAALDADLAFHAALVDVVANPVFALIQAGLTDVLRGALRERRRDALSHETPAEDGSYATDTVHYELVDALRAGDADAARTAIRRHFDIHSLITRDRDRTGGARDTHDRKETP